MRRSHGLTAAARMLSPVPFRICCIAAMAPALTEAASQAESFSLPPCGHHPASPPSEPYKLNLWDTVTAFANSKLFRAAHAAMNMGNGSSPPPVASPRGSPELLDLARTRRGVLERRAERLERRLRRLQLRQACQHSAGQMAAFFEHQQTSLGLPCLMPQRLLHRKLSRDGADIKAEFLLQSEDVKSLSTAALVSLVRKLEESHGSAAAADLRLSAQDRVEGERVSAALRATLSHQERAVDSDATESSSGGESGDDEGEPSLLRQSAAWRWSVDRAALASRWTWLQAQVADLEFRIRQQTDLCRQLRRAKGDVCLEGQDPHHADDDDKTEAKPNGLVLSELLPGCARTRALAAGFRKRKVVVAASALASTRKSARLSATVQCPCRSVCGPTSPGAAAADLAASSADGGLAVDGPTLPPLAPCLICGGRYNSVRALDTELMTRQEKAALLDPGFHPVLSFSTEIPLKLHFEMLLRTGELQKLALRASATLRKKSRLAQVTGLTVDQARKKSRKLAHNAAQTLLSSAKMRRHHSDKKRPYRRHLDGEVTTSESCYDGSFRRVDGSFTFVSKQRERHRTFSTASSGSSKAASPVPSPAPPLGDSSQLLSGGAQNRSILQEVLRKRRGENAFDINNIVIPYSIASATRVERLPYKEILTPKWRALTEEELSETIQDCGDMPDEVEDMTDEAFEARHQVCEEEEKQRFAGLLSKAVITQSKPSGGSQTPHHRLPYDSMESSMSPPPSGLPCCAPCEVDPYEPRTFPLAQEEYEQMVADSPHLLPSPAASPSHMVTDTSPPPLEPGPLESDTPGSGPLELGPLDLTPELSPPEPAPLETAPLEPPSLETPHHEPLPLETPLLEPPPLELLEPAEEPDPGGLTFDPNSYLVPKDVAHPDPPAECMSVVPMSNDDPGWTSETEENFILKLTKR